MKRDYLWKRIRNVCVGMAAAVLMAAAGPGCVQAEEESTETPVTEVNDGIVRAYEAEKVFSSEPYISEAEPEVEIGKGTITKENNVYTYQYTAPRSGSYYVKMTDVNVNCYLTTYVRDSLGNVAGKLWNMGGDSGMVKLEEGETYTISVERYQGYDTPFRISIIAQKESLDVSEISEVKDQISFSGQRNVYFFTPKIDGRYGFVIDNMTANTDVYFYVWDSYGTKIVDDWTYYGTKGEALNLEADTTYEIQVKQYRGIGKYTLHMYQQKEMRDVTGYTEIHDSVEMAGQKTRYKFVAPATGIYKFGLTDIRSNFGVDCIVWDYETGEYIARNGGYDYDLKVALQEGVELEKGHEYCITINESDGLGNYTVTIAYPAEAFEFLKNFKAGEGEDASEQDESNTETEEPETENAELQRLKEENENMKNELSEMQKQYEELYQIMSENGIISD